MTLRRRIIEIDGVKYYADRPKECCRCFFWKNRKIGCILGSLNCYYLAEPIQSEEERRCENCCYAKARPCASAFCSRELEHWFHANWARRKQQIKPKLRIEGILLTMVDNRTNFAKEISQQKNS